VCQAINFSSYEPRFAPRRKLQHTKQHMQKNCTLTFFVNVVTRCIQEEVEHTYNVVANLQKQLMTKNVLQFFAHLKCVFCCSFDVASRKWNCCDNVDKMESLSFTAWWTFFMWHCDELNLIHHILLLTATVVNATPNHMHVSALIFCWCTYQQIMKR